MRYPVGVLVEESVGVTVPDLPGLFTSGPTVKEAMDNLREAVDLYFEDHKGAVPTPSPLVYRANLEENKGMLWTYVDISFVDGKPVTQPQ